MQIGLEEDYQVEDILNLQNKFLEKLLQNRFKNYTFKLY